MMFGADFTDYNSKEFLLPKDNHHNPDTLKQGTGQGKVYLGLDKWGHKNFVGSIYPSNAKNKDYLSYYVKAFNAIELNATHYKIYSKEDVAKWAAIAGTEDFLFCPKMLQAITHKSGFLNFNDTTYLFMEGLYAFGAHLGPVFLQLPETFPSSKMNDLVNYLQYLKNKYANVQFFLEIRNTAWFEDKVWSELANVLRQLKVGFVITDSPGRRDALHMTLTVPNVFIRFVGVGNLPSDDKRLQDWKQRINTWKSAGLENVYLFLHLHDESTIPSYSKKVQKMFQ
jgi:uncharacterized protein YecE (DUF72 family)